MESRVEGAQQNVLFAVSDSAPTCGGGVRGGKRRLPEAERRRTIRVEGGVGSRASEREGRRARVVSFDHYIILISHHQALQLSLSLQICVSTSSLSIFRQQILEKIKTQPKGKKRKEASVRRDLVSLPDMAMGVTA